jgi:hypothetical protein
MGRSTRAINPGLMVIRPPVCYLDANAKSLAGRPTMSIRRAGDDQHIHDTVHVHQLTALQSYRVELTQDLLDEQGQLLDWVIGYAFETLEAQHLDLRIIAAPLAASLMTR